MSRKAKPFATKKAKHDSLLGAKRLVLSYLADKTGSEPFWLACKKWRDFSCCLTNDMNTGEGDTYLHLTPAWLSNTCAKKIYNGYRNTWLAGIHKQYGGKSWF